jgi:hypothetical protein
MRGSPTVGVLFVTLLAGLGVAGAEPAMVKWDDVIGILQPGNLVGTGTGQVAGGGLPWTTQHGRAQVDLDKGRLRFDVKGLVLAGGNSIGTRSGIDMVKGTLVCDTNGSASGDSVLVDTDLVPLSPQGDAKFSGEVSLPSVCLSEADIAFLIRTAGGAWLAAGSVREP